MRQLTEETVKTPTHLHPCDVCATVCTCADCQIFADSATDLSRPPTQMPLQTSALPANPIVERNKKELLCYRNILFLKSSPEATLVGHEVCTGL